MILAVSSIQGQLLHFNRAALDMHGFAGLDECRRHLTEFPDTFELSDLGGMVWPVDQWPLARILHGETLRNLEVRIRRVQTGWQRVFNYGGTIVHDPDGQPLMAIVTIGDITERNRAQEALKESEESYRLLFESNPLPMWVFELDTLSFWAVNDAAIGHYGFSLQGFLSMTIKDIRPQEDIPALLESLKPGPGLKPNRSELWRHRKKDGTLIDVEITSNRIILQGKTCVFTLANDVTERKRVEEQVREHAALLDIVQDAIFETDLDNHILFWNKSAEKVYGWTAAEVSGWVEPHSDG